MPITSQGQYWGEMGFFRIETNHNILGIESNVVWATPGSWTVKNKACYSSGANCDIESEYYEDPSTNIARINRRILDDS